MTRLLDTEALPARQRGEAVADAMRNARVPAVLTHQAAPCAVYATLDLWGLGGDLALIRRTSSGIKRPATLVSLGTPSAVPGWKTIPSFYLVAKTSR